MKKIVALSRAQAAYAAAASLFLRQQFKSIGGARIDYRIHCVSSAFSRYFSKSFFPQSNAVSTWRSAAIKAGQVRVEVHALGIGWACALLAMIAGMAGLIALKLAQIAVKPGLHGYANACIACLLLACLFVAIRRHIPLIEDS